MPGCCLFAALMFFGPRVALALAWFFTDWYQAFDSGWVGLVGWIAAPWTCLAWMFVHFRHDGDISGGYVVLLAIAVLADVGAFSGSRHAQRNRAQTESD